MKAGIAAAVFAIEAIRRAGVELHGSVEISGTVDEESGGFAGVAWLAERKRIGAHRTDFVIIPEPLGVDRICVGALELAHQPDEYCSMADLVDATKVLALAVLDLTGTA